VGLGVGAGVTAATGVISAGLLTATAFREHAATDNNAIAAIPVMSEFADFMRVYLQHTIRRRNPQFRVQDIP
jgi:hypothetical protein